MTLVRMISVPAQNMYSHRSPLYTYAPDLDQHNVHTIHASSVRQNAVVRFCLLAGKSNIRKQSQLNKKRGKSPPAAHLKVTSNGVKRRPVSKKKATARGNSTTSSKDCKTKESKAPTWIQNRTQISRLKKLRQTANFSSKRLRPRTAQVNKTVLDIQFIDKVVVLCHFVSCKFVITFSDVYDVGNFVHNAVMQPAYLCVCS